MLHCPHLSTCLFVLTSLFLSPADMRRDVQEIFRNTPHGKQVMMFSATLSKEIRPVCKKFMQDVITTPILPLLVPSPPKTMISSSSSRGRRSKATTTIITRSEEAAAAIAFVSAAATAELVFLSSLAATAWLLPLIRAAIKLQHTIITREAPANIAIPIP